MQQQVERAPDTQESDAASVEQAHEEGPAGWGPGEVLHPGVRARMEAHLGPIGPVRVHAGPAATAAVRRQGATAMTLGPDIAFAAGEYRPGTVTGDALLAHELAHVAQQRDSAGTGAVSTEPLARHHPLERDADVAAAGVVLGERLPVRGRGRRGLALNDCGGRGPNPIRTVVDPSTFSQAPARQFTIEPYQPFVGPRQQSLGARLESRDASERSRALTELTRDDTPSGWRSLLLASDSPHEDVRSGVRRRIGELLRSTPAFADWVRTQAAAPTGILGDLAVGALVQQGRGRTVDTANYRNILRQRIVVVRSRLQELDGMLYERVASQMRTRPPRDPFTHPQLDDLERRIDTMTLDELAATGARVSALHQQVGMARAHVDQLQTALSNLPTDHPMRAMAEGQLNSVLVLARGLTGEAGDRRADLLTTQLATWPVRLARAELTQMITEFRRGREVVDRSLRFEPRASFRRAYGTFATNVLSPLRTDMDAMLLQLERAQSNLDQDPDEVRAYLERIRPQVASLGDRLLYAMQAVAAMLEYSEMALTGESAADVLEPTMLDFKGLFADFATLAHLRDRDPQQAAELYEQIINSDRFKDAYKTADQWREIQEGELRFAMFLADVLTVVVAIYTAGFGAGLMRGALGVGRTALTRAAIGGAVFATEVATFHVAHRGLRWATRGEEFYGEGFWRELGETALLFGALKGVGAAYTRFVNPRVASPALRAGGRLSATYVTFQTWAVGRHMWEHGGRPPSASEFWRMARDNALFLGALHLGMKVAQPLVAPIQGRVIEFQISRHNARGEQLREQIERFQANRTPGEGEAAAILRQARALYLERLQIFREVHRLNPSALPESELRDIEGYLRSQADACTRAIETGRFRMRQHETDPDTFFYEGEPAVLRRYLEGQGYAAIEVDARTGRLQMRAPDGRVIQLVRSRLLVTGARSLTPEGMDAEAARIYGEVRARTAAQVRVEVSAIARHTRVPRRIVELVRRHLFLEMYDIPVGPNQAARQRFDPLYEIADLWQRAERGPLEAGDQARFEALMAHEYVEARLMQMGMPYRSAHPGGFLGDISMPTSEHFGAHDLAPLAHPTTSPFRHWRSLGFPADRLRVPEGELLGRIDSVVDSIVDAIRHHGRGYRIETDPATGRSRFEPVHPETRGQPVPAGGEPPTGGVHGARTVPPGEPVIVDLFHGTSRVNASSVRGGIRVDVNAAHPGRQQYGPGFYLGSQDVASEYAGQTTAPAVVAYRRVGLGTLGEVLDVTQGDGAQRWNAYLDSPVAPGLSHLRRTLWQANPEARGSFFTEFLRQEGLNPDVVIAPHGASGRQVVIRTTDAAARLQEHLE